MAKAKGGGGLPKEYRGLKTPSARRQWLAVAGRELVTTGRIQLGDVTAEERRIEKATNKVRPKTPSPACVDDYEQTGLPFPPRADDPRQQMRRARHMLNSRHEESIYWPRPYLTGDGATYDVVVKDDEDRRQRVDFGHPSASPTARALEKLRETGGIIETKLAPEFDLETESTAALKAQVASYLRGQVSSEIGVGFRRK